jgi:hypothetical protein
MRSCKTDHPGLAGRLQHRAPHSALADQTPEQFAKITEGARRRTPPRPDTENGDSGETCERRCATPFPECDLGFAFAGAKYSTRVDAFSSVAPGSKVGAVNARAARRAPRRLPLRVAGSSAIASPAMRCSISSSMLEAYRSCCVVMSWNWRHEIKPSPGRASRECPLRGGRWCTRRCFSPPPRRGDRERRDEHGTDQHVDSRQ